MKKKDLKILEPLKELYKDEVRDIARILGVPEKLLKRHPFPGPGLAIRIPGIVTKYKINLLQQVDEIYTNFLKENKTEISILEKQVFVSIGWKQLIATKFRNQVMIQDPEIDTIHNKLKSNIGKKEFFIEQIFISFENKNENEVLNKINNLYKQILGGGDFVSIATQFSDKFGGKTGKMGWIPEVDLDSKILNEEIQKILLIFGGSDDEDITRKILPYFFNSSK